MILVEGSLSGQEICVKAMTARCALGEVGRRLDEQLLDEQVVLDRVAEEDRRVDVGVVEGVGVGLVLEQGRTVDAKDLQRQSGSTTEPRVGPARGDPLEKRISASCLPGAA